MGTMVKFTHIKKVTVLAFVVLLAACGAGVKVEINSHTPSNSAVIYLDAGESREFRATGPVYSPYSEALLQVGVRAQWEVYKYNPDNYLADPVFNIIPSTRTGQSIDVVPATSVNANRFEFEAPENQPAQYYLVTYTVYRHNIGGTWTFADSSRSWLLYVGESQQTPPQWEGDFLVSSTEDLDKIENYTAINGALSIMPFTPEGSDSGLLGGENLVIATSNIDNRELKYSLPLGIRSEENLITNLSQLSDINHVSGNLHLFSNSKLASFEELQGLQNVDGHLMVHKNEQIANLSGLENINLLGGDLYLQSNPMLESIDALVGLQTIDGSVVIAWNGKLENLAGLANVSSISGHLNITGATSLSSLDALSDLEFVGGDVSIKDNDLLTSLNGLESLLAVGEDLVIDGNGKLESLQQLEGIESIQGVTITSNPVLENLNGLNNLTQVTGNIRIQYHDALNSLSALSKITSIGGDLEIGYNYVLEDLSGLEGITRVEKGLSIQQNPELVSIGGLNNLEYVKDGFHIKGNFNLCDSEAQALFELVESRDGVDSEIVTIGNDDGC